MKTITSHVVLFSIVLFCAVGVRVLYAWASPIPIIAPDTYGYNSVGFRILNGTEPILSDERTPVYPLILASLARFAGRTDDRMDTTPFITASYYLTLLHMLAGVTTVILIFFLANILGLPILWATVASTLTAIDVMVFAWERELLTESFATLMLVLLVFLSVKLIAKTKNRYHVLLLGVSIVALLLKPVFLIIPVALYGTIAFLAPHVRRLASIALAVYILVLISYVGSNIYQYHYTGINHVTDVNMMGRILQWDLSVPPRVAYNPFARALISYRARHGVNDPYMFLWDYDPTLLTRTNNIEELNQLKEFATTTVLAHLPSYLLFALGDIPHALSAVDDRIAPAPTLPLALFWRTLFTIFTSLQMIYGVTLGLFLLSIPALLKNPSQKKKQILIIGIIVCSFLISTVFGSYGEFGRLLSPLHPLFILLTMWYTYQIYRTLKNTVKCKCYLSSPI